MVAAAQHEIGLAGCCHCSSGRDARRGWQRRDGLTWARSCWVSSRCGVPGWMWAALGLWVWKFLKVAGGIGLFKGQVVWFFLFGCEYGSDSMGFDLWRLFVVFENCFWVELNGRGDFSSDLWRLFLGFWFEEIVCWCRGWCRPCSIFVLTEISRKKRKKRKKKEAILKLNLWFFFFNVLYVFFTKKTIIWIREANKENHSWISVSFEFTGK